MNDIGINCKRTINAIRMHTSAKRLCTIKTTYTYLDIFTKTSTLLNNHDNKMKNIDITMTTWTNRHKATNCL